MAVQDMTPVAIDTALAELYYEQQRIGNEKSRQMEYLHSHAGDKRIYRYGRGNSTWQMSNAEALAKAEANAEDEKVAFYNRDAIKRTLAKYGEAKEALAANHEAQRGYGEEFRRRGGWTRAFLVNNGDGHVHSSMNCSTCNRGQYATSFQWMTDYSDHDEAEIVAAAGWRACTICYPSAPTGDEKSLPTKMFSTEDISKAEAKKEREAAKAAREAKKKAAAPTASGEPLRITYGEGRYDYETFQTERSAMIWATDKVSSRFSTWRNTGETAGVTAAIGVIAQAIADKRGVPVEKVMTEIETKGKKKWEKGG